MCEIVRAQWAGVTVMAGISQRNSYHLTRASPLSLRPTQWGPYKYSPQLWVTSAVSHFKIISSSGLSRPGSEVSYCDWRAGGGWRDSRYKSPTVSCFNLSPSYLRAGDDKSKSYPPHPAVRQHMPTLAWRTQSMTSIQNKTWTQKSVFGRVAQRLITAAIRQCKYDLVSPSVSPKKPEWSIYVCGANTKNQQGISLQVNYRDLNDIFSSINSITRTEMIRLQWSDVTLLKTVRAAHCQSISSLSSRTS